MNLKGLLIDTGLRILKMWWFIVRPEGRGAKVVLRNGDEVLMVQHSYGHKLWTFPGGGVKSKEASDVAACREVYEELGVEIRNPKKIGSYFTDYEYKKVTVDCYVADVETKQVYPDNFEIAHAEWFPLSELPQNRALSADKIMTLYESQ